MYDPAGTEPAYSAHQADYDDDYIFSYIYSRRQYRTKFQSIKLSMLFSLINNLKRIYVLLGLMSSSITNSLLLFIGLLKKAHF